MYNPARVKPEELSTYAALGDPKWKGRLCLRSSTHVYNQSLLATMIKRHGEARTEDIVRGWVANEPILISSDTKILESIAAGQCDVGLTNTYYLGRLLLKDPKFPVRAFWADQAGPGVHVNVSGAGVIAHSKRRADAIKFIEFLSTPEAQALFAEASMEFPANQSVPAHPLLRSWGTFKADDINVAAAGEFQPAATRLADRAGYK
jgi:iron(III) transport system substrate-binding protein